ncbi:site-specific integrase [Variovorax boronicumulans]|uniref:site-specific integrase n=1 Tax=Variovorax boronicumulans TaxID=436515 RepID=UPI00132FB0A3|nr:site-specific integrase [Variovorax boronicumulans]
MSIQLRPNGTWQVRVKHRLLNKPYFSTFDTEPEARQCDEQFKAMLKRGVVPVELLETAKPTKGDDPLLIEVIREYTQKAPITRSDDALLTVVLGEIPGMRASALTVEWVETWVLKLKLEQNLAPGTIRKRIGVLARVMDWHIRRRTPRGQARPANALRGLPTGYSHYSKEEAARLGEGQEVKEDVQRDRRLLSDEEARVRAVLAGGKMPGKRKGLKREPVFGLLFDVILDTGMRLQEAFTLRVSQLELDKGFIRVDGSKGARGKIKPRTVPIRPALVAKLRARVEEVKEGRLFPWLGQTQWPTNKETSSYLSKRFSQMFEYADVKGFTEHDLRHEATCRWVSLKAADGRWLFGEAEIAKIMGWTGMTMMLRYLSLRGEDLSNRFA